MNTHLDDTEETPPQPFQHVEVERVLANLFPDEGPSFDLAALFEQRLSELGITQSMALEMLNMQSRTLKGLLDGTQQRVDFSDIALLASFLHLNQSAVFRAMAGLMERADPLKAEENRKRGFILQSFDLVRLQKIGFIDSIKDMEHVEARIKDYFGLDSIYDYNIDASEPAYSSSNRKPKNLLSRTFFRQSAYKRLSRINNYYPYDREKLKAFIPYIRTYTKDVSKGLYHVTRALFKLGVTVHYHEPVNGAHIRGATFAVAGKPCIVLVDYTAMYPSLWFALMHELYHVLFDWDTICQNRYHITTDADDADLFKLNEETANEFSRNYLFGPEKVVRVKPFISNPGYVEEFAKSMEMHPSIIYAMYCWSNGHGYGKYMRHIPQASDALNALGGNPWQKKKPIRELMQHLNETIYNNL